MIGNAIGNTIGRRRAGVSKPAAPLNLAASTIDEVSIGLTWDAVEGADSYKIYYGTDGVTFGSSTTSATNSKTVEGLTAGVLYYFYVVTVVGSSESVASNLSNEVTYSTFEMQSIQPATISQVVFTYSIIVPGDIWLDWGNGTVVKLDTGQNLTKTSNYATNNTTYDIKIYGALYHLYQFKISNATCITDFSHFNKFKELEELYWSGATSGSSGDFNTLPSNLTKLTLINLYSSVSGAFNSLPSEIEYLYFDRVYSTTGDLSDLPRKIKYLRISSYGATAVTHSLSGMPPNVNYLHFYLRVLNGDIGVIPKGLVFMTLTADTMNYTGDINDFSKFITGGVIRGNSLSGYLNDLASTLLSTDFATSSASISVSSNQIPIWASNAISFQCALSEAEVDLFLNTWAETCGTGVKTINLAGTSPYNNAPRSSASDAAVTDMQTNHSKTFVFNT